MTLITVRDYGASVIRTLVPIALTAGLTKVGITGGVVIAGIPLDAVVAGVCVLGYYAGIRALEARWPRLGILLGWAASPTYVPARGESQTLHH